MQVGKEELPERLFEGCGTFGRDANPVLMRPFGRRRLRAVLAPINQAAPDPGGHQEGKIAIPMGGHVRHLRQLLQQDRRAGARESADKDRRLDRHRVQASPQDRGFDVSHRLEEVRAGVSEASEPIVGAAEIHGRFRSKVMPMPEPTQTLTREVSSTVWSGAVQLDIRAGVSTDARASVSGGNKRAPVTTATGKTRTRAWRRR